MRKAKLNVERFNERARKLNMLTEVVSTIVEKYEGKEFYIDEEDCFELFGVTIYNLDGFGISDYELEWLDEYENYPKMICPKCNNVMDVNANEYDYFYECKCGCLLESDGKEIGYDFITNK